MPRAKKSDKFCLRNAKKSGYWKDKIFISVNFKYEGNKDTISLKDLMDFLAENKIDPSRVALDSGFMTTVKIDK